ncbi:rhomboid family intramembrane serine protease [Prolixibacteraceae bacterium JC049]|nr:rhomboid family intramembrane serine protease [Prolixibacteraceae bacterium JC049]
MTLIIVIVASIVSVMAFRDRSLMEKLQFNASRVYHKKEWHRLVSHAFVHGSYEHLIINMLVLYSFGMNVERTFGDMFGRMSNAYFLLLFFGGVIFSSLYSLYKHRDNYYYNAVGASGGVASVMFTAVFFEPWSKLLLFGIVPIPGIVFAVAYLAYSYHMAKKKVDNIGHDAHFLGAVFGFVYPILLNSSLFSHFIEKLFGRI